ncbi:unnamed protein product [Discula destructiva]
MPPHLNPRFQSGPSNMAPYQHQFTGQPPNYPAQLGGNPSHLNPNAQIASFANGNMLSGLGGSMNSAAASFGMGHETGLGSQAVRQGFNSAMPQQQHAQQGGHAMMGDHPARTQGKGRIREVWAHNLEEEMAVLRKLVQRYPYIAMDTEFPGVVARPMGCFRGKSDYHYQCMRANVDLLKVIQIGIVLLNEEGETPGTRANAGEVEGDGTGRRTAGQNQLPHAWQFNFQFDIDEDMYNEGSIESLQVAGINFDLLKRDGIDPHKFAALLIPSGLVCFEEVRWLSFHGGYDFGYLAKLLLCRPLPRDESDFEYYMRKFFPTIYDIKHLMKHAVKLQNSGMLTPGDASTIELLHKFEQKSGLENLGEAMKIKRLGAAHQAGSDALLTGKVFFQMREKVFHGEIGNEHVGKIWGLTIPDISNPTTTYAQANTNTGPATNTANTVDNTPPQGSNSGGQNGTPSTPNTASASLRQTPATQSHNSNGAMGPMTPGGPFGNFGMSN